MTETHEPVFERPLRNLVTPIDHQYREQLVSFLEAHGATVEYLHSGCYLARLPGQGEQERDYSEYRVTLPEGSQRFDRLCTRYLVPFTIVFPDGTRMEGQERYALNSSQCDQIVLGVPVGLDFVSASSLLRDQRRRKSRKPDEPGNEQ